MDGMDGRGAGRRVVVLDTETTGLDPASGHRVVEVACIELINLMPSGNELHFYCNPERDMPEDAAAIHGLTEQFLAQHKPFRDEVARFTAFIDQADALVAHNAEFDVRFLNHELKLCGLAPLACTIEDTLALARRKFPGAPASLDALCRRFSIDLADRTKHGALIDTRLLARVYLELMGGQQPGLALAVERAGERQSGLISAAVTLRPPRPHHASEAERAAHQAMLAGLKDALWGTV
jgi:DNA polymerase-3 subunit epsilon